MALVLCERRSNLAVLTLNHSRRLNVLSEELIEDLLTALQTLQSEPPRCVILRAQPGSRVFSAGHNIDELKAGHDPLTYEDPLRRGVRSIQEFPAPIIAMVEGSVWGGAFELTMSCDLVTAAETSTFAITPVNLGLAYDLTGLNNMLGQVGMHILKEMLFTAQPITAGEAHRLGLINRAVPAEQLEKVTFALAEKIAEKAPLATALIKEELRLLSRAAPLDCQEAAKLEAQRQRVADSQDMAEGLAAFHAKRPPHFQGR